MSLQTLTANFKRVEQLKGRRRPLILLRSRAAAAFALGRAWYDERDRLARVAYFKSGKAADGDILTQLADLGGNQLRDETVWSLMKGCSSRQTSS